MKERQHTKLLIALSIHAAVRGELSAVNVGELEDIGHHIVMREAHPLREPGSAGAIDQKGKVLAGINPSLRIPPSVAGSADAAKVPKPASAAVAAMRAVAAVTDEDDAPFGDAGVAGSLAGDAQQGKLGHDGPGPRVLELEGQLLDGVERVRGRHHAACPQGAKCRGARVHRVGREEGEHVALLPAPPRLQSLAEVVGGLLDIGERVCSTRFRIGEDLFCFYSPPNDD